MKRNFELIRKILLQIEANDSINGLDKLNIDDYSEEETQYHAFLLYDAGLINGIDTSTTAQKQLLAMKLTWIGHEFLDNARNETVWNKTQEVIKKTVGSVSIDLLKDLLAKNALDLLS